MNLTIVKLAPEVKPRCRRTVRDKIAAMSRPFPTRIRVDGADHRSFHLIAWSEPVLPPDAPPGIDPRVLLDAVIGKDGTVIELEPASGDPLLVPLALATVRHWVYRPTTLNGVPVEIKTQIDVTFVR
jgi:periplasmic protein TonB